MHRLGGLFASATTWRLLRARLHLLVWAIFVRGALRAAVVVEVAATASHLYKLVLYFTKSLNRALTQALTPPIKPRL
jgi:hypothetical protein